MSALIVPPLAGVLLAMGSGGGVWRQRALGC
jgi:hypothetical protein